MRSIWGPRGRSTWFAVTVMLLRSPAMPSFGGGDEGFRLVELPLFEGEAGTRKGAPAWVLAEATRRSQPALLRVQLDDQRFVDVARQVGTIRHGLEHTSELLGIHFDP